MSSSLRTCARIITKRPAVKASQHSRSIVFFEK